MAVVAGILVVAAVFVIAAVAIGREARRLGTEAPKAVFDLEEATEFVARQVPFEVSARLTYDDVRQLIRWHLGFLRQQGLAGNGDGHQDETPLVLADVEVVDHLLARASAAGIEVSADDARAVVAAQVAYLQSIGALGPEAEA